MSTPIPEDKLERIKQALFSGQKIEAIKLYREVTETGLAEAKDAIEKLEQEWRAASPEKFATPPSGKGCLSVLAAVCAMIILVAWWAAGGR